MRLHNAINDKLYDIRLRDKFVADGNLSKNDVDTYCASLTDDTEKAISLSIDQPSTNVHPLANNNNISQRLENK
ncbi:MAG: hypothetical protein HQK53_13125 [Oligoflexia bacterium]|nr:hypothetical protein [Oligoflexia bacterium]